MSSKLQQQKWNLKKIHLYLSSGKKQLHGIKVYVSNSRTHFQVPASIKVVGIIVFLSIKKGPSQPTLGCAWLILCEGT